MYSFMCKKKKNALAWLAANLSGIKMHCIVFAFFDYVFVFHSHREVSFNLFNGIVFKTECMQDV